MQVPYHERSLFHYDEAFSRNIGLVTREEQEALRHFTIAIPGMGGVGGTHLISFVRQGFEKFKIADFDVFESKNFNRQYGARIDTIDLQKVEVMKEEALKINPECTIETFPKGITPENIDSFLKGVDLVVDSLDAFAIDTRKMLFDAALERNIPVITAGPIGFGTAFLIFLPGGPTFDEYFAIHEKHTDREKLIRFFAGLMPRMLQRTYMKGTNLEERRGPSSIAAVNLCAGVIVIHAIKILLKKGNVKAVPYFHQFDAMRDKYVVGRLPFGNRGLIQRMLITFADHLTKD